MKTKTFIIILLFIFTSVKIYTQPSFNGNTIKFEAPLTAVIAGEDGLALRTTNGGVNWSVLNTGLTNNLKGNDFYTNGSSINVHLIGAENGVILKSADSGASWSIKSLDTFEDINDIFILSGTITYACGNNGTLFFSSDLGENWASINTGSKANFNKVLFFEVSTRKETTYKGLLACDNGVVLTCIGLTGTWSAAATTTTENLNTLSFSSNYVLAGGNSGAMMKSTDYGVTWSSSTTGTTEDIYGMTFIDPSTAIAVGSGGIILRTTDKGDSWSGVTSPVTSHLTSVDFGSWGLGIAAGVNGASVYSTDGGLSWVESEIILPQTIETKTIQPLVKSTAKEEIELLQNYPNPFNPSTIISYSIPFDAQVSVKIYDMLGKEVRTLVSSPQNAGTYSVSFNAVGLSSGIYFYVLRASAGNSEMTKTMRMILAK